MIVQFLDVAAAVAEVRVALDEATRRVLSGGWFILGPEVEAFESEFAAFVGTDACVGVGNGLDAIELALRALNVGPGDEVIVPSNTFIATWLAVTRVGARIVPVEPDPHTYNIDPDRVEAAITPQSRAIVAVHLYGQPADMKSLRAIASAHRLWLVEDSAQAHGATYDGRPAGSLGDVSAWSFYPTKNLGALGDAGAITTNDRQLADRVRVLRNYGASVKYTNQTRGVNSRLDELQAAFLRVKLPLLREWNERRRRVAARYLDGLADTHLTLPKVLAGTEPVWHLFVVRSSARDALQRHLEANEIQTLLHYPIPPHRQGAYADLGWPEGAFPISEKVHREVLSLPMGPHLGNDQVDHVLQAIRAFSQ